MPSTTVNLLNLEYLSLFLAEKGRNAWRLWKAGALVEGFYEKLAMVSVRSRIIPKYLLKAQLFDLGHGQGRPLSQSLQLLSVFRF